MPLFPGWEGCEAFIELPVVLDLSLPGSFEEILRDFAQIDVQVSDQFLNS